MNVLPGTLVVGISMAIALPRLCADDWPQWRGPQRTGVCQERDLLASWPDGGPRSVWRTSGLGAGYASVAISDQRLFTIGVRDQFVSCHALDAESGRHLWSRQFATTSRDASSTPTVDDGRVYALAPDGELVCLEAATGRLLWDRHLPLDFGGQMSGRGYGESPLVDGNWLVCTPGAKQAMLVALNKRTGGLVWKSTVGDLGPAGYDAAGFSSIVVTQAAGVRQYVQLVGRGLIGVAARDGRFLWGYNSLANRTANIPTPIVHDDLVFAANGYNTGSVLLRLVPEGTGGVRAEEVYRLRGSRFQNHHGGVVLLGESIFGGHGSNNGLPTCIDLRSGRVKWKRRGPGVGSAAVVAADGMLYFRYQNGIMALIEATADGYRPRSTFSIPGAAGDSWAHPVIAGGKLYLREQDEVQVYDLRPASSVPEPAAAPAFVSGNATLDAVQDLGATIKSLRDHAANAVGERKRLYRFAQPQTGDAAPRMILVSLGNQHLTSDGVLLHELHQQLQQLTIPFVLNLAGTDLTDSGLSRLSELPNAVGFDLELCPRLSDEGLRLLSRSSRLRLLMLTGTAVSDRGLVHLRRLKELRALDLDVCDRVTDAGCQALGAIRQLRALVLRKAGFEPMRITSAGLQHLRLLTQLRLLDLYGNTIDDHGMVYLGEMRELRELNLSLLPLTSQGLVHLRPLRELRHLELLSSTGFPGPIVTDSGLESLLKLEHLKTLNLAGAQITDRGAKQLAALQRLVRLDLVNTNLSRRVLKDLNAALPGCRIMH